MIFFVGDGRLGNQVFQLAAIRKMFGGERRIVAPTLSSIEDIFEPLPKLTTLGFGVVAKKVLRRIFAPLVLRSFFGWLRLGGYCEENQVVAVNGSTGFGGSPQCRSGLFSVSFVDGGYFQNLTDLLGPSDFSFLKIKKSILDSAEEVVRSAIGSKEWPRSVMHVRRGDYLDFKTYGLNKVILDESYFVKAIKRSRELTGEKSVVLVVTDDKDWCEEKFSNLGPIVIVSGSEAVDFALLSMFPVVILSNSTFSLAAACVAHRLELVVGPEYWFGHEVNEWFPPKIKSLDRRFVYV